MLSVFSLLTSSSLFPSISVSLAQVLPLQLDFWTDTHSTLMNVNYNYTGFYAVQVNYLNGATYVSD
jgi:hypothetical protein